MLGHLIPAAYVVLQKARHLSWDWVVFGGLFVVGLLIFVIDKLARPKSVQSALIQKFQEMSAVVKPIAAEAIPIQEPRVFFRDSPACRQAVNNEGFTGADFVR